MAAINENRWTRASMVGFTPGMLGPGKATRLHPGGMTCAHPGTRHLDGDPDASEVSTMEAGSRFRQDTSAEMPTHPADQAFRDVPRIGSGWVAFAGSYLALAGMLNLIWGITALAKKSYFAENGLLWSSLSTWAWIAIVVAAVQIVAGGLLFARKVGGVIMAIVIAMCGMLVNFLSIGAYPVWSSVAMICNALVLWAVTVHGNDFT
jgi:hypothetical protein